MTATKTICTAGPWGVDDDLARGQRVISGGRGEVIALVVPSYDMTDDQLIGLVEAPDPERDANARLIAKAPELHAVLADLFTHCAMVHKHWGDGNNREVADAAIARGRALLAEIDSGT